MIYGETTIANNTATNSSRGGIALQQGILDIEGNCIISDNHAVRGGGIHATSSSVYVYKPGTLQFINNRAENGSGFYLEINSRLYGWKYDLDLKNYLFRGNHANYYGSVFQVSCVK